MESDTLGQKIRHCTSRLHREKVFPGARPSAKFARGGSLGVGEIRTLRILIVADLTANLLGGGFKPCIFTNRTFF